MKKYFVLFIMLFAVGSARATDKMITSCPDGYTQITFQYATVASAANVNYPVSAGKIPSCLDDSEFLAPVCALYAPVGLSFTDDSGSFEFETACPL